MRPRISTHAQRALHAHAVRMGLTDQQMVRKAINEGLVAMGAVNQPSLSVIPPSDGQTEQITVTLPSVANRIIKEMAVADGRSNRSMTRQIIFAGLKAMGVWPAPAVAR